MEINADKTKCMVTSRDQNARRSRDIKSPKAAFEMVEDLKLHSRLKSRNTCYHSVQNLLSSSLLSKNTKVKIYRTIILPVVLYGCETWLLTLRDEHRLWVFENSLRGTR